MSKYSPNEAKLLYEQVVANTDIIGHAAAGNPIEELGFQFRERTLAVADDYTMEENPCDDTEDGPPKLRFYVDSPWHALIHLSVNNRGWLEGKQGSIRTPLIYRGQRDSRWNLVPSLLRKGTDRLREEQRLFKFIATVRESFAKQDNGLLLPDFASTEVVSDEAIEAIAQHYGIKTNLMDFTSDPAVAVWFACQGGSHGDIASVFALPFTVGALCEMDVILCHPLALRPHRQHGLFIRDSLNQLKSLLIEVRFPIHSDFRIIRDRLPTALFPEEQWWVDVVSSTNNESGNVPLPDSSSKGAIVAMEESILHMLQMLMELTTFDIQFMTNFNHEVIAQITKRNSRMLLACEQLCRSVGGEHFKSTMGQIVLPQMLDHLRNSALECLIEPPIDEEYKAEIESFKYFLPIYKNSHGCLLSKVPTRVARRMLEVCRENFVECELQPEGHGTWIVHVKGVRSKN